MAHLWPIRVNRHAELLLRDTAEDWFVVKFLILFVAFHQDKPIGML